MTCSFTMGFTFHLYFSVPRDFFLEKKIYHQTNRFIRFLLLLEIMGLSVSREENLWKTSCNFCFVQSLVLLGVCLNFLFIWSNFILPSHEKALSQAYIGRRSQLHEQKLLLTTEWIRLRTSSKGIRWNYFEKKDFTTVFQISSYEQKTEIKLYSTWSKSCLKQSNAS